MGRQIFFIHTSLTLYNYTVYYLLNMERSNPSFRKLKEAERRNRRAEGMTDGSPYSKKMEFVKLSRSQSEPALSISKSKMLEPVLPPSPGELEERKRDVVVQQKLREVEGKIKILSATTVNRCAPRPDRARTYGAWDDRFWVTISKSNDVINPYQRQFFGSTQKDVEWAYRDPWRGLEAGGTETNFANVKAKRDLIMRSLTPQYKRKP